MYISFRCTVIIIQYVRVISTRSYDRIVCGTFVYIIHLKESQRLYVGYSVTLIEVYNLGFDL
jgi:hypothetical protein